MSVIGNAIFLGGGSSGSGDGDVLDALLTGEISGVYENSRITKLHDFAFKSCSGLTSVNFPACEMIGEEAFQGCSRLTSVNFQACKTMNSYVFNGCSRLTSVNFPACETIGFNAFQACFGLTSVNFSCCTIIPYSAFAYCSSLATASFPACREIGSYTFSGCWRLRSLYLMGTTIASLATVSAFRSTPISNYTTYTNGVYGSIFVKSSKLASWKTATNWATFSSRFVGR